MTGVPADTTLEAAVLGAGLLAPAVLIKLQDHGLTPEDFHAERHRTVWNVMCEILAETGSVDTTAVTARIRHPEAGVFVDSLCANVPATNAILTVARELQQITVRRRWWTAAQHLMTAAVDGQEEHVSAAEHALRTDMPIDDEWTPARALDDLYAYLADDAGPAGWTTGFALLDEATGGLRPGDVTTIGGFTGMGKSVLTDCILKAASLQGAKCALLMNEMSRRDRTLRLLAGMGVSTFQRLVHRDLRDGEHERALNAVQQLPFHLADISAWPVDRVARYVRTAGMDVIALDVLHNMPFHDTRELDATVGTLLNAARSSGTHLILVAHLNDERAKTALLPPPVTRDIRNSGMIARASATVLMLHRDQEQTGGIVETHLSGSVEVAKSRHGRAAGVLVVLDPARMVFNEVMPEASPHWNERAA
jgi:replicative DNA helicase